MVECFLPYLPVGGKICFFLWPSYVPLSENCWTEIPTFRQTQVFQSPVESSAKKCDNLLVEADIFCHFKSLILCNAKRFLFCRNKNKNIWAQFINSPIPLCCNFFNWWSCWFRCNAHKNPHCNVSIVIFDSYWINIFLQK